MIDILKNKKILIFLDQMIVSGSNFLLGILLARHLGVDVYGYFSLLWLIVLFFSSLQLAFIISPMLTFSSKKSMYILDRYLSSMIYLQSLFTLLLIICLYFFFEVASFFDEKWNIGDLILYVMLTTLFFLFQDFIRRYFIIKIQYFRLIFIDIIAYLGQVLIISYLVYINNLELKTVFLTLSISFGLSFLVGYMQIKKVKSTTTYNKILFLKNWQFSKWLIYSSILQWGSGNFFILAAGGILGSWAVGVIKIMQNLMGIFHVLFIALENILPMVFSQLYKKNGYENMISYFKTQLKYGLIIFIILGIVVYLFASNVIGFIYGLEYIKYSYLLVGFISLYFFTYINILQKYILRTIEKTKIIFLSYIITTIFSFLSSYSLIKYFGLDGVLVGMLITILIANLVFYAYIKRSRT